MIATIFIIFYETIKLGLRIAYHGKEVKMKRNCFIDIFLYIITITLLYYAGLFDKFLK